MLGLGESQSISCYTVSYRGLKVLLSLSDQLLEKVIALLTAGNNSKLESNLVGDCLICEADEHGFILASSFRSKDVPIVMLSPYWSESLRDRAYETGVTELITLPISAECLRQRLDILTTAAVKLKQAQKLIHDLSSENRELARFAEVAAHDLKGPLTTVAMGVELVGHFLPPQQTPEIVTMTLEKLERSVLRAESLVTSLLNYSQSGFKESPQKLVRLNDVISDVVHDLEAKICSSNARLSIPKLPTILGNQKQLFQLFLNLFSNSLKFQKTEGRPYIKVDFRPDHSRTEFSISVIDNGIGFLPQDAVRIFQPFERGTSEFDGFGIGLSTCKRIAEAHEGRITARGQLGKGSVFKIILPTRRKV